jgi:hypothetical protein
LREIEREFIKWEIREKRFTTADLKDGQVNDRIQNPMDDWTKYIGQKIADQ